MPDEEYYLHFIDEETGAQVRGLPRHRVNDRLEHELRSPDFGYLVITSGYTANMTKSQHCSESHWLMVCIGHPITMMAVSLSKETVILKDAPSDSGKSGIYLRALHNLSFLALTKIRSNLRC